MTKQKRTRNFVAKHMVKFHKPKREPNARREAARKACRGKIRPQFAMSA